ncbi:HEAT repeat domain-containing protein [Christiangramia salexigens]|uniref:HEAT repeat domain-containing protein n=1 Tax=Christiangramia salexigens TaxID=1913577 RepID=A0A1L3J1V1_9FLAO|nr:HEAT repeat domain-containing protein [Christiangramia salexigens]APG59122.1 hypothetical protein LPB144_01295 [Christiangramia salexigens]
MNELELLFFIKIVALVLVLFWCSIIMSIVYRKRRTAHLNEIENTFAEVVSRYLYNDPKDPLTLPEILQSLRKVGIKPGKKANVQFLIRLMIRTQRTILGENNRKLRKLYMQIPPYNTSYKKIKSWNWNSKARGIREMYEMNQFQFADEIFKYRDHKNIYVRREAQIALVVFMGWESLRFLPYLKRNMTLWQQIKIVEKLYDLYPQPELKWLRKAYKSERLFAKKLLMRIIRKYELHGEVNFIIENLNHEDYEVRESAIYCITTFAISSSQMQQVKALYDQIPNATQQGQLLNYILENSEMDLEFYLKQLYGDNEELKLSIAEILWNEGYKEKVQEFYYQQYPNVKLNVG